MKLKKKEKDFTHFYFTLKKKNQERLLCYEIKLFFYFNMVLFTICGEELKE